MFEVGLLLYDMNCGGLVFWAFTWGAGFGFGVGFPGALT